ncbi:hypothetical protein G3M48_007840 [Beauveria asiatica]|uniref:Uncharacterized protein n=1 Tax=Beauveria asiatica TaxID=1069075 RepID=A0AAW0RM23_9HYPO
MLVRIDIMRSRDTLGKFRFGRHVSKVQNKGKDSCNLGSEQRFHSHHPSVTPDQQDNSLRTLTPTEPARDQRLAQPDLCDSVGSAPRLDHEPVGKSLGGHTTWLLR